MIARLISPAEYQGARHVWEACFPGDKGAFCEWYFSRRTRAEYIVAAFEGGKMLGTAHMLPQTLDFFGHPKPVGFVAGVATLPEFRRRGVAALVLAKAFELMLERGFCATVLQPFDTGFYSKFGYRPLAFRREYRCIKGALPGGAVLHEPGRGELESIYSAFKQGYSGMEVRGEAEFCRLLSEREAGARLVATGTAYALYYEDANGLDVMELCGSNLEGLAGALLQQKGATLRVPPNMRLAGLGDGQLKPFNMLKPLNEGALLAGLGCTLEELFSGRRQNYSFESY